MRSNVGTLMVDLRSNSLAANGACDEASLQMSALQEVIDDTSAGESAAYQSMRDYLSQVRMPAMALQSDFLLAFVQDIYTDMGQVSEKLLPLGPVVDTDALADSVAQRRSWANTLYGQADDLSDAVPLLADGLKGFADMVMGQADELQRRLDLALEYLGDGSIYAASSAYTGSLQRQQDALASVSRDPVTGAFDISVLDLSWVPQLDEEWQRRHNRAVLERYFTLDDDGNITGVRPGMEARLGELLDIVRQSLFGDGAPTEIGRLTADERYALLYLAIKDGPQMLSMESSAMQSAIGALAGQFSVQDIISRVEDFSNMVDGNDENPLTQYLAFTTDDGIFYGKDMRTSIQHKSGYGDWIEFFGPFLGMDLDTDITTFIYDGKEYRIQTWDGTYGAGIAYGGEVAVYTRDAPTSPSDEYLVMTPQDIRDNLDVLSARQTKSIFTTYESAEGSDVPNIHITVNTGGRYSIDRDAGKGNWTFDSKIVPRNPDGSKQSGYTREELSVTATLDFEDKGLQEAARNALAGDGISVEEDGDGLTATWSR
ncbi:DUF4474 domain-containing protein [Olsenella sp. Marseille-P4559]|uniref:DUF4474 domain-containing protein n=1 Tax=Olsenella sp. Marseille-P4559 TaxID=2364795 RepID=UPI001031B4CB|nr:DUF4474 domain-containing protein [Olsenella sp. Marseille-P4559]